MMTKKSILLTALTIICLSMFAQETKPCLMIGVYQKTKGMCGDKTYTKVEVKDNDEYKILSKQFYEDHKGFEPYTRFVLEKQFTVVYEYRFRVRTFNCSINNVYIQIGATLESCNQQMASLAASSENFETKPNAVFTKQGNGSTIQKETVDFDGVAGQFMLLKGSNGKVVNVFLKNTTTDKLAMVIIQTDKGEVRKEFINPGARHNFQLGSDKFDIQVLYQGYNEPRPSLDVIKFVKEKVRKQVTNENGVIKVKEKKFGIAEPTPGAIGVRG